MFFTVHVCWIFTVQICYWNFFNPETLCVYFLKCDIKNICGGNVLTKMLLFTCGYYLAYQQKKNCENFLGKSENIFIKYVFVLNIKVFFAVCKDENWVVSVVFRCNPSSFPKLVLRQCVARARVMHARARVSVWHRISKRGVRAGECLYNYNIGLNNLYNDAVSIWHFRFEELKVIDIKFLHGCANPTIAFIYQVWYF